MRLLATAVLWRSPPETSAWDICFLYVQFQREREVYLPVSGASFPTSSFMILGIRIFSRMVSPSRSMKS